jgi:AraC-like DNA-binding protein
MSQTNHFAYLSSAKSFIDEHYNQPIDLERIASQAAFSPYHFLRLFRQTFDETPHQYLTRRRIERARELLTMTDFSVTEVCFEVGYESLGSFSTLFRKYAGHSPQHYRARVFQSVQLADLAAPCFVPFCFLMMFGAAKQG